MVVNGSAKSLSTWRSLLRAEEVIRKGAKWSLGDSEIIKFWTDLWWRWDRIESYLGREERRALKGTQFICCLEQEDQLAGNSNSRKYKVSSAYELLQPQIQPGYISLGGLSRSSSFPRK
ncbi:hypothetical protein Nepgr_010126 [Nepenthes gracilis]|uniref:Uncharacterized protein n=1 Tax=Nepenthes gracilis TaxID=150966 RepID=A0AAD3SCG9_NEPGR|nr:hypothetical protein Nepgr_010126 [Nepenthes gracilis]